MEGRENADIAAGITDITARSMLELVYDLGVTEKVAVPAALPRMSASSGASTPAEDEARAIPRRYQIIGAIGAAVIAGERRRAVATPQLTNSNLRGPGHQPAQDVAAPLTISSIIS